MKRKKYQCQSCFQENTLYIENSFCSETIDIIEDCAVCCNPNSISYIVQGNKIIYFEVIKTY
ncbi:MAG: CPXCG motif-containing cysteine-rich protein [Candidatus Marinimicrobia bacterium]|nr:CPXCG motif-containing cysteine-rich protein [Candidatus Neomarinimicrobiota bacterium]